MLLGPMRTGTGLFQRLPDAMNPPLAPRPRVVRVAPMPPRGFVRRVAVSGKASQLLRALRATWAADEVDRRAGRLPPEVTVHVPSISGDSPRFRMRVEDGRDQIARDLWRGGWAAFERPLPDAFALWARRCLTVLDVGANTGFYALLATAVAPRCTVHAFEPHPLVLPVLHRNLLRNDCADRVSVFPVAVGRTPGSAVLHIPDDSHGLIETSASLEPGARPVAKRIDVGVVSLDEHAQRHALKIDLIKIDVETLDHLVLAGAEGVLDRDRPLIFFELLPQADEALIEQHRGARGYVTASLRPDGSIHRNAVVQHDPATWNHVLVPEEQADGFFDAVSMAVPIR